MKNARRSALVAVLLGCAWTATARPARAADPVAEQLYQEGRDAALRKDWAVACEKYRESHDREPAPGTLLNLADCEEHQGKLLSAASHFDAAARLFKAGDERVEYARKRGAAIASRTPRLSVRPDPTAPAETEIELDGAVVRGAALGTPTLVDPGEHVLIVRAPQRTPARSTLRLAENESRELTLSPGGPLDVATASAPVAASVSAPAASAPAPTSTPTPVADTTSSEAPWKTAGYVSLAVGGLGLGFGILGGALTIDAKNTADSQCHPGCSPSGIDAESRGKTWSAVSTVGFVLGGVGVAAGAAMLWLVPRTRVSGAVVAGPTVGGAQIGWLGQF